MGSAANLTLPDDCTLILFRFLPYELIYMNPCCWHSPWRESNDIRTLLSKLVSMVITKVLNNGAGQAIPYQNNSDYQAWY